MYYVYVVCISLCGEEVQRRRREYPDVSEDMQVVGLAYD